MQKPEKPKTERKKKRKSSAAPTQQQPKHPRVSAQGSPSGNSSPKEGTPDATTSRAEASEATGGAAVAAEGPGAEVTNAAPAKAVDPLAAKAANAVPAKAVEPPAAKATNAVHAETTEHGAGGVAVVAEGPGADVEIGANAAPSFADVATQTDDVAQAAEVVEAVAEPHKAKAKNQLIPEYKRAKVRIEV